MQRQKIVINKDIIAGDDIIICDQNADIEIQNVTIRSEHGDAIVIGRSVEHVGKLMAPHGRAGIIGKKEGDNSPMLATNYETLRNQSMFWQPRINSGYISNNARDRIVTINSNNDIPCGNVTIGAKHSNN